jgi:hypothetical protein
MKKWILALVMVGGSSVGLAAPIDKLSCANEFQESLEVSRDTGAAVVSAVFTSNGVAQSFDGKILSTGKFEMNPTAANERVVLSLVRPRDHGGGCGRCAIDSTPPALAAQLVVGPGIFVFQCQPKEL